jgi:hypothetical protein
MIKGQEEQPLAGTDMDRTGRAHVKYERHRHTNCMLIRLEGQGVRKEERKRGWMIKGQEEQPLAGTDMDRTGRAHVKYKRHRHTNCMLIRLEGQAVRKKRDRKRDESGGRDTKKKERRGLIELVDKGMVEKKKTSVETT